MPEEAKNLDLRGFLAALRRRRVLIALCAIVLATSALAVSLLQTKQYSSTASLLFRDPGFDQQLFGSSVFQATDPTREAATNLNLVSLRAVADRTAQSLGGGLTGAAVSSEVSVAAQGQSNLISVTTTDPSPDFAARLANAFAEHYIAFRRNADRQQVADARRLVERDYVRLSPAAQQGLQGRSLQDQISKLQTLEALQTGNAELVQRADRPTSPSSPKTTRNTVLGGVLGLLLGVGLALLFERLDRRLRDPGELEETFSLPVLARIPDSKALAVSENGAGSLTAGDAESFRMLRTRLRYFNVDRDIRSVLVTSPSAGDGKTTVAWHLARSAAEGGARAIMVEADFHRPTVAERRKIEPLPGLAEYLSGQAPLERVIQKVAAESRSNGAEVEHHLDVIVAGATPPNPAQILESEEMSKLVEELRAGYELTVIDTAPAVMIADAIPLMRLVDGVIVVGDLGKTTRDEAVHLRDQLRELDAPALGVVANRARSGRGYYGYYGYGEDGGRGSILGLKIGRQA